MAVNTNKILVLSSLFRFVFVNPISQDNEKLPSFYPPIRAHNTLF